MNIKGFYWFTGGFGTLGIVTGEDETTGTKRAYIGQVDGYDEDKDTKHIAEHGSPLSPPILRSVLQDLGEPNTEELSNKLLLAQKEAEGYGSLLLDVQKDCANARQLVLKVLNVVHPAVPALSEMLEMLSIPIEWDETKSEFAFKEERKCRVCGCTDLNACVTDGVPCHWVEEDLCSACVGKEPAS